jgi:hypothetical protein
MITLCREDLPLSRKSQISKRRERGRKEIMVSPEQERIAKILLDAAFNFNVRSFKDGIRRIVLNDQKTFSTANLWFDLTLRLKNSVGQV